MGAAFAAPSFTRLALPYLLSVHVPYQQNIERNFQVNDES